NPLLQDIGLALHPPMLYVGYIGFSVVFSLIIAGLLQEKITPALAKIMQFWLFLSWGCLTLGIGLGSWWAYRELGWGGYWFWDPVENVSLMPWLAATALIHALRLLSTQNICKIWVTLLAITNFTLCLIGIFLTRSGLLTSVHSFAVDAKRGFFIILLITIISGIAMLIFALKVNKIKPSQQSKITKLFSKNGMIFSNNYLLIIALFTTLLGTLYPILSQTIFDQSISIGAKYYNQIFTILLLPFLAFLASSYFTHYKIQTGKIKIITRRNSLILLTSASLTFLAHLKTNNASFSEIILLFLALNGSFLALLSRKSVSNIAHLGFTLLVIGIILSSLGSVKEVNIKQGEIINVSDDQNYQIRFDRIDYKAGQNFLAREGIFTILENGKEVNRIKPQLRYYPVSDQTTNEAAIQHGFFGDLYLAIGNKDENNFYALRIYYKPFIYLIWLGCLIMSVAAALKVVQFFIGKKNEVLL
ncbi:MAG: heme lyase CcmF/NrfE family subunit, partial [Rickettsiales bacterium]|nr:heme lyase CcmF/NrfE family subunit [Rickettsiales bacterium]